jgi:hypothetical protein
MASLLSLAPETLAEIILLLNYDEVILLWLCGNSPLNWKLSKGKAVRKIEIFIGESKSYRWPSILPQFAGLEAFKYLSEVDKQHPPLTVQQLFTLPRNLKKLEVSASQDVEAVSDILRSYPEHFSHLRSLSISTFTSSSFGFILPATIEILTVGSWRTPLEILKRSKLPGNLVELRAIAHKLCDSEEHPTAKLPETLQLLHLFVKLILSSLTYFLRFLKLWTTLVLLNHLALSLIGAIYSDCL